MRKTTNQLLSLLVNVESSLQRLPPLSPLQRAKLEQERAIEHLYYSSKIEGTNLSERRLEKAIQGDAPASAK